jgi:ABC-type nitrate/sulfonate/bicarbonate transport system substrate-binding protein
MPPFASRARSETATPVRAAMIPIELASLICYASDNGFFAKAGLTVEIAQNPSTPPIVAAA